MAINARTSVSSTTARMFLLQAEADGILHLSFFSFGCIATLIRMIPKHAELRTRLVDDRLVTFVILTVLQPLNRRSKLIMGIL
jgi:hypothetical protein